MIARQTIPCLEAFAYAVRSLWGFHVIYSETGHGNLEMDWSHDSFTTNSGHVIKQASAEFKSLHYSLETVKIG